MAYNLSAHPIIQDDPLASNLSSDLLDAHEQASLDLLESWFDGLDAVDSSHSEYDAVRRAVALQVVYAVHRLPEAEVFESVSQGNESLTYRQGLVSPMAFGILEARLDMDYETASFR